MTELLLLPGSSLSHALCYLFTKTTYTLLLISSRRLSVCTFVPRRLIHHERDLSHQRTAHVPEHRRGSIRGKLPATSWPEGHILSPHHAAHHARLRLLLMSWNVQRLNRSRWWRSNERHDIREFDMRSLRHICILCVLFWVFIHVFGTCKELDVLPLQAR